MIERVSAATARWYIIGNAKKGTYYIAHEDKEIEGGFTNSFAATERMWELRAIAAIKAMREPTEVMIEAGFVAIEKTDILSLEPDDPTYSWGREWSPCAKASYTAMLNAALGEHA